MLKVEELSVSIGSIPIIRDASLFMTEGQMCGLIGRNGAGKTTLLRALMGALPASGKVTLGHVDLLTLPPHRRAAHGIGYMPEDRRLMPHLSAQDNILLPAWITESGGTDARLQWIYTLMPEVAKFSARHANQLSGGQQKLLALARALMCGTKLLLLDEPFEGLAPALARRLAEVLTTLKTEGLSVFMAESNETHVRDLFDQVFLIERGTIAPR